MRTISQNLLDELDSTRTVGARVEFRKTLLSFDTHISNGDSGIIATVKNYDSETVNSNSSILRVANVGDVLYYQYASDPTSTSWGSWTNSGRNLRTDSKVGLCGTRVFYHGSNNTRYYADFTLSPLSLGSATAIGSSINSDLAMAPVNSTNFFQLLNTYGTSMPVGKISQHATDGSGVGVWHGRVYGPNDYYRYFDAVALNDERYVFFVDQDEKRIMYINGTIVAADEWTMFSNAKPLIELDAYDDNNKFKLAAATVIDGKIFVTGILYKTDGSSYHIYMMGPEPFTMGRDQYITYINTTTNPFGGKLHLIGSKVYYIGPNMNQWADATTLVGYDNSSLKLDTELVNELNTSESTNGSMRIGFRASTTHSGSAAITGGGEAKVYVSVGAEEGLLNTIGIDQIIENATPEGADYAISGRGNAIKRMTDWNADASYDMWSQSKIVTNFQQYPSGDWVRYSGLWEKDAISGYYSTTEVNVENILYSACRPSRNGIIEVEFTKAQSTEYDARWGVMLNFYAGDYDDEDSGHSGIAFILSDNMYGDDGPGAELYKVIDGTWTQLSHNHYSLPGSSAHWLHLSFNDGLIVCEYRLSSGTSWTNIFTYTWEEADQPPWFSERYEGRAAIYTETVTPNSTTYGFDSISDVIPLDSITDFPSSDSSGLIVDSERIQYTGKSPNNTISSLTTDLSMVTWGNAPHDVTEAHWQDGTIYKRDIGDTESDQPLSTTSDNGYFQRSFFNNSSGKIRYIKARAKKAGAPTGNLYCYLVSDAWDDTSPPNQSAVIAYGSVTPGSVGTSYAWHTFDLGALYTVDVDNYWIVFANVAPPSSPSVQPTNYYIIGVDEDIVAGDEGITRVWGSTSEWYSRSPDAVIPMEAIGYNNNGDGYEIYFDGAASGIDRDAYDNCALVFTDDAGIGHSYKITDYDYQAPDQWVPSQTYEPPDRWQDHVGDLSHGSWVTPNARRIFVEQNPSGTIKDGMSAQVRPALYGLTRGWVDTTASTHSSGTLVSIYENSSVELISGRYMSGELDMSWEDTATNIARKSGVLSVTAEKSATGTKVHTHAGWSLVNDMDNYELERKYNFVARFKPTADDQEIGIWYSVQGYTSNWHDGYIVTVDTDDLDASVRLYSVSGTTPTLVEKYETSHYFKNTWITISTQLVGTKKVCSVWSNGTFIKSFTTTQDAYGYAGFVSYDNGNFIADWPELDMFVDNFVIDMGKSAYGLMERLIGDKQCFIRDHEDGGLYLYQNRASITTPTYDYIIDHAEIIKDIDTVTRLRLEGAVAYERADFTLMKNKGIVFRSLNAPEVNNWYDVLKQSDYMMDELKARRHMHSVSGMCDPRVQANDIIRISGPTDVVIDAINTSLVVDDTGAKYDMKLEGYNAP